MRIALLHYHLKPGGVTTVIRHQVEALQGQDRVMVLSGAPPETAWPVPIRHIPGIAYQNDRSTPIDPQKIAREIHQAIQDQWEGGCDILHIHNPLLAKNHAFLDIIKSLQEIGITLFLQIHDFAEDGRPHAYFLGSYPRDCHYGVINSRDYRMLLDAGLKTEGLHLVFNPVKPLAAHSPHSLDNEILYPVRAIRRKNIGEALLLSLYFNHRPTLAITLPPNSPVDIMAYKGWKQFAHTYKLNIHFDAGLDTEFEQLVGRARLLLTTSITEGFGYTFLEAWTAGKPVWGRDLADITQDFTSKGLCLDHFYRTLLVPLSWMDHQLFFDLWKNCILENSAAFKLAFEEKNIHRAADKMRDAGLIDFGLLGEFFQKQIMRTLLAEPTQKDRLAEINPFLKNTGMEGVGHEHINHNRQLVLDNFSAEVYRESLLNTYQAVMRFPAKQRIDKHCLAASFFNLDAFSMLKWGRYVE